MKCNESHRGHRGHREKKPMQFFFLRVLGVLCGSPAFAKMEERTQNEINTSDLFGDPSPILKRTILGDHRPMRSELNLVEHKL
jgi:hypothetical protein